MTTRPQPPQSPFPAPQGAPLTVHAVWAAATDVGKVRTLNEDAYFASESLWVVADGMGGHSSGDVASALAVEACRDAATEALTVDRLAALIADANQRVRAYAITNDRLGMGCTMVGAAIVDNGGSPSIVVFNIGDSRCYLSGHDGLRLVTTDHSYVQELVDAGELAAADAEQHPQRNVVTRAIGIDPQAAADFVVLTGKEPQMRLLLCSDGVHGELDRTGIERRLADGESPRAVVDGLAAAVLQGRARDNLTAIVVDVVLPPPVPRGHLAGDTDADITGPRPRTADATTQPVVPATRTARIDVIGAVPGIGHRTAEAAPAGSMIDEVPT